jgi:DNA-directed RNA polymerase specialized sigma24 family protein
MTTGERRPTPAEHLRREEKRIRALAARATAHCPEWREDIEQEMRIRAVGSLASWDPEKGPLSAHSWRHMTGSAIGYRIRALTAARGWRQTIADGRGEGAPQVGSLESMGDEGEGAWEAILGEEDDGYRVADARAEVRAIRKIMQGILDSRGGKKVDAGVMLERVASLACFDEMGEVARRQGVSRQAVHQSAHRARKALREVLGVAVDG